MIVHGVQFAAAALQISEWALCEPTVRQATAHITAVHMIVKRRAKFFLVNVASVVCSLGAARLVPRPSARPAISPALFDRASRALT